MLKTISAALLAVSVIAAPAFAAQTGKTTTSAPVIKTDAKTKAMNARAAIAPGERKMVRTHRHHHQLTYRHHHKLASAKASLKTRSGLSKPAAIEKRS